MNDARGILEALSDAISEMDEMSAALLAREALDVGVDTSVIVTDGLTKGMDAAGRKFESGEYFVPELLLCSDAFYAGLDVLRPHLATSSSKAGRVVIGVVEGDTHDIGKNLVRIMLESAGFQVLDLGRNVPCASFIDAAIDFDTDVIALSTLITTTMDGMRAVIDDLVLRGLRDRFKVVIGGAPTSPAFANKIGADGYAVNATKAVHLVQSLVLSVEKAR